MNILIKKKDKFKELVVKTNNLICPICKNKLNIFDDCLICENKHTYNINKKGYVSLFKKQKKFESDIYTKGLFENRRSTILSGIYSNLHNIIANYINNSQKEDICIFELGCGEATHSLQIKNNIKKQNHYMVSDISTDAVELATEYLKDNIMPIICDAYNLPLKDKSVDFIIDILSPFYYKEAIRVLKDDGYFIKVIPEKDYLKEIRKIANIKEYSKNNEVLDNFSKNFDIVEEQIVNSTYSLNKELAQNVLKMTPLTNNINIEKELNSITINLKIVFAKKKTN